MTYVKVEDWMLELGLKPGELLAFAVVYSFGKDGGWFQGSASYLGKWMRAKDRHTVYRALDSLTKKGLIEMRERWEKGEKMCDYRPGEKCTRGSTEMHQGGWCKMRPHNNRSDSNRDNKEINNKERVYLTVDEFKKMHR